MITFVSKLPLHNVSINKFHKMVESCHSLDVCIEQSITHLNNGYILQNEDVVGYHIEDESIYEYIFKESTNEVYISIDKRGTKCLSLLDHLINENLFACDGELPIGDNVHDMNQDCLAQTTYLPILYFTSKSNLDIVSSCAKKLLAMVHVVLGNEEYDAIMMKKYRARYHDFGVLCNQDCLRFSKSKTEIDEDFANRIYYKMQMYMSNRVYEYPFNMNELYQAILLKMVEESRGQEELRLAKYDEQLDRLKARRDKIIRRIEKYEQELEAFIKPEIEENKALLEAMDKYPLVFKGKIEEKYIGEQKDIVLSRLVAASLNENYKDQKALILEILAENPEVGKRRELLEAIDRILKQCSKFEERVYNQLRKQGVEKLRDDEHGLACFFGDKRYLTTLPHTGEANSGRQVFRKIRATFF